MLAKTAERILALAEEAICTKGYASFSFRELASQLGIKSASVHYHFPTKADLGLAVAKHYRQRYSDALTAIESQHDLPDRLPALIAIYRQEMPSSKRVTLCTMLAAEKQQFPDELQDELQIFYQLNINWLRRAAKQPEPQAAQIFALLQGAFTGGKALADPAYFDTAVDGIKYLAHPSQKER